MNVRTTAAGALLRFVQDVFLRVGYPDDVSADAADVLLWASLRGVDTHGVRNLKSYYVDRTLSGQLRPSAEIQVEYETEQTASLDGGSGLGLSCACKAMRLAIEKSSRHGIGIVCVRNTHHLGPAGYFAHMAVEHDMLGLCMTGHFFGRGNPIGIAPLGGAAAMFSTNPLSFAAPCSRHAPFVLDMSTAVATVNRIEMRAQGGETIPAGWACDAQGKPTTLPERARLLVPLGGTAELGGFKGTGLAMMVSILSGVLSGAWRRVERVMTDSTSRSHQAVPYDQPTMGHLFAAVRIDLFQPPDQFRLAMDAMIDALHAAPTIDRTQPLCYPGEIEAVTAAKRQRDGIPTSDHLLGELRTLADQFKLEMPHP